MGQTRFFVPLSVLFTCVLILQRPLPVVRSRNMPKTMTITAQNDHLDVDFSEAVRLATLKYSSTNWQSDSENYAKFSPVNLVFPGTHDSGSYYLTSKFQPDSGGRGVPEWLQSISKIIKTVGIPIDELVARWAKTQKQTIFEQLRTGARYLDLRCGWQPDTKTWKIHHSLVGVDVVTVLEDIKSFVNAFKTEVVIVEMSHFYGDPDEDAVEQLASEVLGALGELVVPYYPLEEENFWTRPLEESVKKNQRVLIAFENFNAYNTTEKHSPFLWPWVLENGYADTDDVAKMKEYNYDVVRTFNNQTEKDELRLTKLSWILTAKAKTVENSIWPLIKNHHPKTIVDLTLKYADRFVFEEFVDLVSKDLNCRFPQVFSLDAWFADSSFRSRSSSKSNNSKSNNGRTNRDDDEVGEKEGENRKGVLWKLAKEVSARQNSPAFAKEKCKANAFADDGKRLYSQQ